MAQQADDRLLVAGVEDDHAFALRLLTSGGRDPGFVANAVGTELSGATAIAVKPDGSILVAGNNAISAASVMQLQANGELDILFGNAGTTLLDLPSEGGGSLPAINDVTALADGRVLIAGEAGAAPFVVRLLGDSGGDSPGVVGVVDSSVPVSEPDGHATVTVRRTGGSSGTVSVDYRTKADPNAATPATGGEDYTDGSARLTWNDGDVSDKQITVPIADNETPEELESFLVALETPQGGVGLGTSNATVEILGDGAPNGQFSVEFTTRTIGEAQTAQVIVSRNYYDTGAVSVTLTAAGGTATLGDDFEAQTMTLSWDDGVSDVRVVDIPITNDSERENIEDFSVALSAPTGGAILGPRSTASISIDANDQPPPTPPGSGSSGGGGALGFLSLLWLAAGALVAAMRRPFSAARREDPVISPDAGP